MYIRKSKLQYHAKPEKSNPIIARRLQEILGGQWNGEKIQECWPIRFKVGTLLAMKNIKIYY